MAAVFFTLLWLYTAANYRLVDRHLDPSLLRTMTRRHVAGMVAYLVTFLLAFVNVTASLFLIVVLAPSSSCPNRANTKPPRRRQAR